MGGREAAHFFAWVRGRAKAGVQKLQNRRRENFSVFEVPTFELETKISACAHSVTPDSFLPTRISTVDDQIASGEIAAGIRRQVNDGGRNFARFADPAHRREF
jgi:hypothetical protein